MSEMEDFYDAEIAPKLAELAGLCVDHGMSFTCAVEFGDVLAETSQFVPGYSPAIALVKLAIRASGNLGRLVLWLQNSGGGGEYGL